MLKSKLCLKKKVGKSLSCIDGQNLKFLVVKGYSSKSVGEKKLRKNEKF